MTITQPLLPPMPLSGMPPFPTSLKGEIDVELYGKDSANNESQYFTAPGYNGFEAFQWVEIDSTTNTFIKASDTSTSGIALSLDKASKGKVNYVDPDDNRRYLMVIKEGTTLPPMPTNQSAPHPLCGQAVGMHTDAVTGKQYIDISPTTASTKKFYVPYMVNPIVTRKKYNTTVYYLIVKVLPSYRIIS